MPYSFQQLLLVSQQYSLFIYMTNNTHSPVQAQDQN